MRTDDLIANLAGRPSPAARPAARLAAAVFCGWLLALAGMVAVLGPPLAAVPDTGATPFALKVGYTVALAALAAFAALAAGRPGQRVAPRLLMVGLPVLLIGAAAVLELASAPRASWDGLMFGSTFETCFLAISLASIPLFAAIAWAFRSLAPTQPALAGMLAGLSAGAAGAVAYAAYCPETTASFLLVSYTPGIIGPAIAGALLGPRLLRW
jgi:hypothetical protein